MSEALREALEIGLDLARNAAAEAHALYDGYPRDGLGRRWVAADRDVAVIEAALSQQSPAPSPDDMPEIPRAGSDRDFSWVYTAPQMRAYGNACFIAALASAAPSEPAATVIDLGRVEWHSVPVIGTKLYAAPRSAHEPEPHIHEWAIWPETDGLEQRCRTCGEYRRTPPEDQFWKKAPAVHPAVPDDEGLTDERIGAALEAINAIARDQDKYEFGLPLHDEQSRASMRAAIRAILAAGRGKP